MSALTITVTQRRRIEVSSTSSTRQRSLRRRSATIPAQARTSALILCQRAPRRRAAARNVITLASETSARASLAVSAPSKAAWSSRNRLSQLSQTILRRDHTSVVRRPDTSKSWTFLPRRSWTLRHMNPHIGQRSRLSVDSTLTTRRAAVSSTTPSTRICGK